MFQTWIIPLAGAGIGASIWLYLLISNNKRKNNQENKDKDDWRNGWG